MTHCKKKKKQTLVNLFGQTSASRCESSSTFQRLAPSHLQGATDDLVSFCPVYIYIYIYIYIYTKVNQSHYRPEVPRGFQEVEAPRFHDNRHVKAVRLSALTHRPPLPRGNAPGTHFCYRLSQPQAILRPE